MSPSVDNTFDLTKQDDQLDAAAQGVDGPNEQISAADYDPSLDRREDEEKRVRAVVEKDESHQNVEMIEVEEEEEDDFDDMFALDVTEEKPKKAKKKAVVCLFPCSCYSCADDIRLRSLLHLLLLQLLLILLLILKDTTKSSLGNNWMVVATKCSLRLVRACSQTLFELACCKGSQVR